jgi:hypothetical protein
VRAPLAEVGDARREPFRVQAQPQHIHRRLQQRRIGRAKQRRHSRVVRDQRPVTVDRNRRVGLVALEHELDRLARRLQGGIAERALGKHRREAGRHQQHIALAQRHVEAFGKMQHHLARRLRAAGLQEAQMLGGNLRFQRKVELTEAAALAPFPQVIADGTGCLHVPNIVQAAARLHYLRVNRLGDGRHLIGRTGTALPEEIARRAN